VKTAFVLSGGASLGAIQAGMLRALFERGIEPDLIVATSVGALNGAYVSSRPPTIETADELAALWRRVRREQVFPLNPLTSLRGLIGGRSNLVSSAGLRRIIEANVAIERLEDLDVPLHVIATDLFSGRELRLSEGRLCDAVMASAAIPGVFAPVEWGETELVDGGVSNNTPITHAIELGAERIYVLPTGTACALEQGPRSVIAMSLHAMSLLVMQRLTLEIEALRGVAQLIVLPPPCPLDVQPIDFSRSDELIERGLSGARDYLESVAGASASAVPFGLGPHTHSRSRSRAS
jgi:NTE family protein